MTSRHAFALLLLAACGDDSGVNKLKDAPLLDTPPDGSACPTADLSFGSARGLVIAGDGTLYYSTNQSIGVVPPCSAPQTEWFEASSSVTGLMLDPPNHALYFAAAGTISKIDLTAATPTATPYATVPDAEYMTLGPDGALWATGVTDVVRITAANTMTTVTTSPLDNPKGLAFRTDGTLLVNEYGGGIVAIHVANHVETSRSVFAREADAFYGLEGIALDVDGNAYVTNGDGIPGLAIVDPTGNVIGSELPDDTGGHLDFGAGSLTHGDLYVAVGGDAQRLERTTPGATVPWHAL